MRSESSCGSEQRVKVHRRSNVFNLLGDSLVFEGDLSALVAAPSGQDVDDSLLVYACGGTEFNSAFSSDVT